MTACLRKRCLSWVVECRKVQSLSFHLFIKIFCMLVKPSFYIVVQMHVWLRQVWLPVLHIGTLSETRMMNNIIEVHALPAGASPWGWSVVTVACLDITVHPTFARGCSVDRLGAAEGNEKWGGQKGLLWRAREREPITGVWGRSPQRGPGAEPLVRGSPWSWKAFCF